MSDKRQQKALWRRYAEMVFIVALTAALHAGIAARKETIDWPYLGLTTVFLMVYVALVWPWRYLPKAGQVECCECQRVYQAGEAFCYGCGHKCTPRPVASSAPRGGKSTTRAWRGT